MVGRDMLYLLCMLLLAMALHPLTMQPVLPPCSANTNESGWLGVFTPYNCTWPQPANLYFTDLMCSNWTPVAAPNTTRLQWVHEADANNVGSETVFRLPSDMALREASVFSVWAMQYANNETMFITDFQRTLQRMLQLGSGMGYQLRRSWFHWKGFSGDWFGYGTKIAPLVD